MNPSTDRITTHSIAGKTVHIVQPGANRPSYQSRNWRLTEEAFRRYELYIDAAVTGFEATPKRESQFACPDGISPNTFVARVRDALQALILYGYNPTLQARLKAVRSEITVSLDPDGKSIWFRERQKAGRRVKLMPEHIRQHAIAAEPPIEKSLTPDELSAICQMHHSKLKTAPTFIRGQLPADVITDLETRYDVGIVYDPETLLTRIV